MGSNPVNLALRFFLELAAWGSMGYWGWTQHKGVWRIVLGVGVPLLAMVIWGTFRVQDDPRAAPVEVPGLVRLAIEAATFGMAVWLLAASERETWALVLGVVVLAHYLVSYDRIRWLLTERW